MITVNIYYKGTEESINGFIKDMIDTGIVDRTRSQEGNVKYEYFKPVESKGVVLLMDQWTSQEALDIHHSSPMMSEIIELRNKYNLSMEIERYILDNDQITEHDKKFIK